MYLLKIFVHEEKLSIWRLAPLQDCCPSCTSEASHFAPCGCASLKCLEVLTDIRGCAFMNENSCSVSCGGDLPIKLDGYPCYEVKPMLENFEGCCPICANITSQFTQCSCSLWESSQATSWMLSTGFLVCIFFSRDLSCDFTRN